MGALPVMILNSSEYGPVINSGPFFGSHGGPIALNSEAETMLLRDLIDLSESLGACSLTVIENPLSPLSNENLRKLGLEPTDQRISQITFLPTSLDEIHPKTRYAIRQAGLHSPVYSRSNAESDWDWMKSEHDRSMAVLGGIPKSKRVFELLRETFGSECQLWTATVGDSKAAALVILTHGLTIEYFTPVVAPQFRSLQILSGLIWEVMTQMAAEGFKLWNWGGTWLSQEGVYRFKSRWNADNLPYRYFTRVMKPEIKERTPDELRRIFPHFYVFKFDEAAT